MVEFGLKLEDNKVAEWAEFYINYEKLKAILKKLKEAAKKRDELVKRRPDLAKQIQEAYEAGSLAFVPSRVNSSTDLKAIADRAKTAEKDEAKAEVQNDGGGSAAASDATTSETAQLLKNSHDPRYGSNLSLHSHGSFRSIGSNDRKMGDSSVHSLIKGVTGYFSKSKYENKLRDALIAVENQEGLFAKTLVEEVDKVNAFYDSKLEELESRLKFLVDSVRSSKHFSSMAPAEDMDAPGAHRRRRRVADMFNRLQNIRLAQPWNPAESQGMDDELSDNEEAGGEKQETLDRIREADSVRRAITDQQRMAKLLHNFSIINYTGFVKIIKKHDKTFPEKKGYFKEFTDSSRVCDEGSGAEEIADRMEKLYAKWFCGGNIREARAQILPKRGDGLQTDWSQLRLGYRLGMCSVLALWVCWDCIWGLLEDGRSTIGGRTAFPVFRACGGLLLLHWLWGISVYVWSRYRVNYIYLFDFNPKLVDSPTKIFNDVVDENLTFLVLMLLYYKSGAQAIPDIVPGGVYPFILVLFTVKHLLFPWKTRSAMWKKIYEVATAPFHPVSFFHTYIGDVLTSMVKVFQDIAWTLGFILSGDFLIPETDSESTAHDWQHAFWYKNVLIPLICLFPLWFRFNQCLRRYLDTKKRWPNLANAFKYAMSQTVTLFGAFHPLYLDWLGEKEKHGQTVNSISVFQIFWMMLFVASSLYSFCWDVFMDWGLGLRKYGFLGPRLMYPQRWWYYAVMLADFVLRFMWVQSLIPPQSGARFELPQYLTAVTMSLELVRRTVWAFFRLENEHRSNTDQYRRVSFVPLHFNTGHAHKYKQEKEHTGWRVLLEVAIVSLLVIGVSVSSVVAAQRATRVTREVSEL